ncbi:MAG: DUF3754 domain-containing protein [Hyphomicrobiaceae bacterium]|nr:DUF3754 domain-containing protein [Hyphomicrobiaceae bacterium]
MTTASIPARGAGAAKPSGTQSILASEEYMPMAGIAIDPHSGPGVAARRERFLPLTRAALLSGLTEPAHWPNGGAADALRFMRYLDFWRRHAYTARLVELEQAYDAFAPDSDLKVTRQYTSEEREILRKRVVGRMAELLEQGNFTRVDPKDVHLILTEDSHYGLDLQVDLDAFEEALIYFRGATTITERRRDIRRAYMGWKEVQVPVFQRLCLLFKLKPSGERVEELVQKHGMSRRQAEKAVRRGRALLPKTVSSDHIYMKLFKNIPRTDVEMIFPNTKVRFRRWDKIRFGVSAGGGVGMGVVGTVTKIAAVSNPMTMLPALAAFGGIILRQVTNFFAQRNRYMVVMAQNLYFHSMADNRGVITLLSARAAEEDIKEEILLYAALARGRVKATAIADIDARIETWLKETFGIEVNFDVSDALSRLKADGIVRETEDGWLETLSPAAAAKHVDMLWDRALDDLGDNVDDEGTEVASQAAGVAAL